MNNIKIIAGTALLAVFLLLSYKCEKNNDPGGLDDYPCTAITCYGAVMACNWLTEQGVTSGILSKFYSGIDEE